MAKADGAAQASVPGSHAGGAGGSSSGEHGQGGRGWCASYNVDLKVGLAVGVEEVLRPCEQRLHVVVVEQFLDHPADVHVLQVE